MLKRNDKENFKRGMAVLLIPHCASMGTVSKHALLHNIFRC